MFGSDKVVDNVRTRCISTSITEPLAANIAHNNTRCFMNTTIFTCMFWQITIVICLLFFFFKLQFRKALCCSRYLQLQRWAAACSINLEKNHICTKIINKYLFLYRIKLCIQYVINLCLFIAYFICFFKILYKTIMPYFVYNIDITLLFFLPYLKILILNRKQFKQFTLHNTMKCSPYKNLTSNHWKTTNHVWKTWFKYAISVFTTIRTSQKSYLLVSPFKYISLKVKKGRPKNSC